MALQVVDEFIVVGVKIGPVNFLGLIFAAGNDEKLLLVFGDR